MTTKTDAFVKALKRTKRGISNSEAMERFGFAKGSLSSIVHGLIDEGFNISSVPVHTGSKGRPSVRYVLQA